MIQTKTIAMVLLLVNSKQIQDAPPDEFNVKHLNIMYNPEIDRCFCLLEAPSKEDVKKHHEKMGITCEWIMEVNTTV